MKCQYCGIEMDNPAIFYIHESRCLEDQIENGLIEKSESDKEEKNPNETDGTGKTDGVVEKDGEIDYSSMTVEQLKTICKDKGLEGYSNFNKDDLVKFIQENLNK